jgi:hypothetical protein
MKVLRVGMLLAAMTSVAVGLASFVGCGSDEVTEDGDPTTSEKDGSTTADGSSSGDADGSTSVDACGVPEAGVGTTCIDGDAAACPCGLTCSALRCVPKSACNEALLSWTGPTQNDDGTCLRDLAGFNVYWGPDASANVRVNALDAGTPCVSAGMVACDDAGGMAPDLRCSHRITGLTNGPWFFAVTAYTDAGIESPPSVEGSKTIACP